MIREAGSNKYLGNGASVIKIESCGVIEIVFESSRLVTINPEQQKNLL